jgi:hypothetical protein
MVSQTRRDGGSRLEGLVDRAKVVVHEIERYRMAQNFE